MSKPSAAATRSAAPFALGHFVAGRHVAGTSGREGPVFNPATGALRGHVAFASDEETRAAIANVRASCSASRRCSRPMPTNSRCC
jgi:acyl-CoA reductase-like NAD-dependent aldehyde dehydrogenase